MNVVGWNSCICVLYFVYGTELRKINAPKLGNFRIKAKRCFPHDKKACFRITPENGIKPSRMFSCFPLFIHQIIEMQNTVDFESISIQGLESSPFAPTLAGLRANEASFRNKYNHDFKTTPAGESRVTVDYVSKVLREERDITIDSELLETSSFQIENTRFTYVFYKSGIVINLLRVA